MIYIVADPAQNLHISNFREITVSKITWFFKQSALSARMICGSKPFRVPLKHIQKNLFKLVKPFMRSSMTYTHTAELYMTACLLFKLNFEGGFITIHRMGVQ
ncbi:unnamed protein product [Spodoptera exigua]|nr:unnamed protein product [Spodoptera exigua]